MLHHDATPGLTIPKIMPYLYSALSWVRVVSYVMGRADVAARNSSVGDMSLRTIRVQ